MGDAGGPAEGALSKRVVLGSPSRWAWSDGKPRQRRWGAALALALAACAAEEKGDDTAAHGRPDPVVLPEDCSTLPMPDGAVVVSTVADLRAALADARAGDTVALSDGTYDLSDGPVEVPGGVTLRGASGAGAVLLDGGFATPELVQLETGATVAELTLARSYGDAVVVRGRSRVGVYGVRIDEPGGRGVAILPDAGFYSDATTVGCVTVTRAGECDIAVEVVQADGTAIYGVVVDQPACDAVGIKLASGSHASRLERTRLHTGGTIGLQLGDVDYAEDDPRVYADASCGDETTGHIGGEVRNVFAVGGGVRLESACGARVEHVSAWGGSIGWSFVEDVTVANNLAPTSTTEGATLSGNLTPTATDFVDAAGGDLHLAEGSAAIDAARGSSVGDDVDGEPRDDGAPDVGADERR